MLKTITKKLVRYLSVILCLLLSNLSQAETGQRPLSEVLEEVGEAYQVFFTYNHKQLDNIPVEFDLNINEPIDKTLDKLLKLTNFTFVGYSDKYYVIYEKTKKGQKQLKKFKHHINEIEKLEQEGLGVIKKPKKKNHKIIKPKITVPVIDIIISGTVKDADGFPLIGTTVMLKNSSVGTATDIDGNYSLSVPKDAKFLVFSYTGFKSQEIPIDGRTQIDAILEEDIARLEEVVVVGYGTQKKRELSGSVSSVSFEELENTPIQSFDKAIQGRSSGVHIVNSGAPGGATQVRIRGIGSINSGNQPLFIVDGVQVVEGQYSEAGTQDNVLSSINPNDIVSIDILKDGAASIYGAQAANGVVIITTKRGKAGKTQFNFNTQLGSNEVINRLDMLNGPEWTELVLEGYANRYGVESSQYLNQLAFFGNPEDASSYDWQDLLFQRGFLQNYQLSATGGNDQSQFFVSGSYNNTEGHVIGTGFQRGTIRINLDNKFSDRIRTSISTNFSITNNDATRDDGFWFNNPTIASAFIVPINDPYNADGSIREPLFGLYDENPLVNKFPELFNQNTTAYKTLAAFTLEYDIASSLKFKSIWGADILSNNYSYFASPLAKVGASTGGGVYKSNNRSFNWQSEQILQYDNLFNDQHALSGLLGVNYRQQKLNYFFASGEGLASPRLNALSSAGVLAEIGGNESEWNLAGLFGRLQYTYDNKYILSASLRRDGSSRFGTNNRWGWFPAVSAAWRISSEPFFDGVKNVVYDMKLRGSYGVTGNANIDNFVARGFFAAGGTYLGQGTLSPSTINNPELTWEQSQTLNLGLDLALFNGRLDLTADYFIRNTNDLLLDRPVPTTSGYSSVLQNIGKVQNQGFEIGLNTVNLDIDGLKWTTNFNLTKVNNEIKSLTPETDQINLSGGLTNAVGSSLSSWFAIPWAGVNPADGRPLYYDIDDNLTFNPTDNDRRIIGGSLPTYFGGLTNVVSFNNFELTVFFQYSGGNYLRNNLAFSTKAAGVFADRNQQRSELDRWQNPGHITDVPIAYQGAAYDARPGNWYSSRHIEKGDYVRLKQINISYNIPSQLLQKWNINSLSIYGSGNNLWTNTNYSGRDPEILGGNETGDYPQAISYVFGLNLGF